MVYKKKVKKNEEERKWIKMKEIRTTEQNLIKILQHSKERMEFIFDVRWDREIEINETRKRIIKDE